MVMAVKLYTGVDKIIRTIIDFIKTLIDVLNDSNRILCLITLV